MEKPDMRLVGVGGRHATSGPLWDSFCDGMNKVLDPLYGSQESAIAKIKEGADREAFALVSNEFPDTAMGVLVYKTTPVDEVEKRGVAKALEIKSLFLTDAKSSSKRGGGSIMLARCAEAALKLGANALLVSVDNKVYDSKAFFRVKGFVDLGEKSTSSKKDGEKWYACLVRKPKRIPIYRQYYELILHGRKPWEGRINKGAFRYLREGDQLEFYRGEEKFFASLSKRREFRTFEEMIRDIGVRPLLPDKGSMPPAEAVELYRSFPGYRDQESIHGVVAFCVYPLQTFDSFEIPRWVAELVEKRNNASRQDRGHRRRRDEYEDRHDRYDRPYKSHRRY